LLFLNCSDLSYKALPFSLGDYELILMNSKVKHRLVDSAYNERVQEIETILSILKMQNIFHNNASQITKSDLSLIKDKTLKNRALHVLNENQRVFDFIDAMNKKDFEKCGSLLSESHNSLRDLYKVSCEESDFIVENAVSLGALGARQMGGGFGGTILMLLPKSLRASFQEKIMELYFKKFALQAEFYPVEIVDGLAKSL
jgi:galactokinase